MRNTIIAGIAISALSLGCQSAMAQSGGDLNYSYIEGGVSVIDIDERGFSETEVGFNFRGSVDLGGALYAQGAWDRWEIDVGPFELDTDLYKFGLGYRFALQPSTDLFVEGSYAALEVESVDEDGFRGDVGLRHGFNDGLEGRVFGGYQTGIDEAVVGADLLFKFQPNFGLSVGVETYEFDLNIYRANLRLSF